MRSLTPRRSLASIATVVALIAGSVFAAAPALADDTVAPTLVTPTSGTWEATSSYHVEWTDLGDPQYAIQLSSTNVVDSTGSLANVSNTFTFGTNSSDGPFGDGSYYYQIKGISAGGVSTDWSPVYELNTDTTAPAVAFTSPSGLTVAAGDDLTLNASIADTDQSGAPHTVNTHFKVVGYGVVTPDSTENTGSASFTFSTAGMSIGSQTAQLATKDQAGNLGNVVQLPFTVTPKKVTLNTPADGTFTNNSSPTLSWLSTNEGDSYELQAATDNSTTTDGTFAHPGIDVTGLAGTDYTPTAPVDATYYWHVRAVQNGVDGPWSDIRGLTVDTVAPDAPTQVAPAYGALVGGNTVDLQWTSPEVGATYTVRSSTSDAVDGNGMLTGIGGGTADTTAKDYTVAGIPDDTYYWQVRATDAAGNVGAWSPAWPVTIDTTAPAQVRLTSPDNGSYVTTGGFDFVWQAPEAGDHYIVEGSPDGIVDPTTGDFVTNYGERTTTTTSFTNSAPDGTYYWHVRAIDAAGNVGTWSIIWSVTVDSSAPVAVVQTAPANGADLSVHKLAFSWTSPEVGATYQVRWSLNPHTHPSSGGNGDKLDTDVTSNENNPTTQQSFLTGNLPDGTYYWQVLVTDAAGNVGQWSPVWTVTLDTVAPAKVHLVSPSYGAYENTTDFALAWTALAHETNIHYTLQWSTNPTFTQGLGEIDNITSTPYQFTGAVEGTYYWHVRATDGAGNVGAWSDSRKLTVDLTAPVAATLLTPVDHTFTNDSNVWFSWSSAEGNTGSYILRVSPDGARSGGLLTDGINIATRHDESYYARHMRDGSYYWQVLVTDAAGNVSPWSDIRKVTVDTVAPHRVNLISPADNALLNTPSVVLTWQAVERHATYTIEWSASPATRRDGSFRHPITNGPVPSGSTTTDTTFTVPGAVDGVYYWHVVATDRAGNQGDWSHTRTVTIDETAPVAVTLIAPASGTTSTTGSFDLSWTPDSSAANYTLELSHDSDFSTLIGAPSTTTATDAAFTGIGDTSFFWRVRATDAAGNVGDWSDVWTLTVAIPVPATPTDGSNPSTPGTTGGTPATTPDAALTEQLPTHALSPDSGLPSSTKSTKSKHSGITTTSSTSGIAWWVWALSALAFLLLLLLAGFIFRRRAQP
ncbi:MAG: aqualysin 1 [Microbacteriaceae bacterium]|nr:aqualysin 1 [Microbacteriaceae bacterium]